MGYVRDEMDEALGKQGAKRLMRWAKIIGIFLVVTLAFTVWPLSVFRGLVTRVTAPQAIIYNYQWYYDQYNAIRATEAKIRVADVALAASKPDTEDYNRRVTERAGIEMVLEGMIGEYNSRSRQITRNLWKANDLPYEIEQGVVR